MTRGEGGGARVIAAVAVAVTVTVIGGGRLWVKIADFLP